MEKPASRCPLKDKKSDLSHFSNLRANLLLKASGDLLEFFGEAWRIDLQLLTGDSVRKPGNRPLQGPEKIGEQSMDPGLGLASPWATKTTPALQAGVRGPQTSSASSKNRESPKHGKVDKRCEELYCAGIREKNQKKRS